MRPMVDSEEKHQRDPEVTLGMVSLLGIFFGLVILCGVFFGFGYSMGHRGGATSVAGVNTQTTALQANGIEANSSRPAAGGTATSHRTDPDPTLDPDTAPPPPASRASHTHVQPPVSEGSSTAAPSAAGSMVQIAAVSRPGDAEVLLQALRKRGYSVRALNEPQDKLLHVQIGPFATRVEANAMRQKLLADGYNAIIK